jgi:hypothetical protein
MRVTGTQAAGDPAPAARLRAEEHAAPLGVATHLHHSYSLCLRCLCLLRVAARSACSRAAPRRCGAAKDRAVSRLTRDLAQTTQHVQATIRPPHAESVRRRSRLRSVRQACSRKSVESVFSSRKAKKKKEQGEAASCRCRMRGHSKDDEPGRRCIARAVCRALELACHFRPSARQQPAKLGRRGAGAEERAAAAGAPMASVPDGRRVLCTPPVRPRCSSCCFYPADGGVPFVQRAEEHSRCVLRLCRAVSHVYPLHASCALQWFCFLRLLLCYWRAHIATGRWCPCHRERGALALLGGLDGMRAWERANEEDMDKRAHLTLFYF